MAANKRGCRSVFQDGSRRKAWLWGRMENCHWREGRQWREAGGRAQRQVHPLSTSSMGPAVLTRVPAAHPPKMLDGGRKKAITLEIGPQKCEKLESWGKQGYVGPFTYPYFLSRFPAKSVCQWQEIPHMPTSNRGGRRQQNGDKVHAAGDVRIQ